MEKQKFTTRHRNSWTGIHEEFEVEGELCFDMYGFKFFVHGYSNRWNISEVETGFYAHESTQYHKKRAIADAKIKLESLGEDTVRSGINKAKDYIKKFKHEFDIKLVEK